MNHFGIYKRGDKVLGFKVLKLKTEKKKNIYYNKEKLKKIKSEIEDLLNNINNFDVSEELISSLEFELGKDKNNLANGYYYILANKQINKENLKELYDILSKDLLDDYSIENMGEYYRKKDVYILDGSNSLIGSYDKGMNPEIIEEKMDDLFEYINKENENDLLDVYIKSQIIHYYLSYVHPYFDVNGRCARTLSMWYLIKQNAYPFIIFNKGIYKNRTNYKKSILKCNRGDVTPFLEFSLKILKKELEEIISYEDTTNKKR